MGRKRRKVVRLPKKQLPKIYLCPQCGKQAVKIEILMETNNARVWCGSCGLTEELSIRSAFQEIDAYCQFTDKFYSRAAKI